MAPTKKTGEASSVVERQGRKVRRSCEEEPGTNKAKTNLQGLGRALGNMGIGRKSPRVSVPA